MNAATRVRWSGDWKFVAVLLGAFVFSSEIRRLVDWRGNYDPLNFFVVIPLLLLCPLVIMVFRRRSRLGSGAFTFVAIAWLAGFGYALLIALAHGSTISALYSLAQFCLPVAVGAWLITRPETMQEAHARIARTLLIFGVIASVYGIVQYALAPPWDTEWMQNVNADSFGEPVRFGIRVFSVLNGPGVFALFLSAVILFNLPYLRVRSLGNMACLLAIVVALALTLVRSAWLAAFIGIFIFVLFSPKRTQAIFSMLAVLAVCAAGVTAIIIVLPGANTTSTVTSRLTTLSDIGDDPSALARKQTAQSALNDALEQPAGSGLGIAGAGSQLAGADVGIFNHAPDGPIDNGFVTRFFEMGVPGFAAFLIAGLGSFYLSARAYARYRSLGDNSGTLIVASCIATQIVLFAVNFSGDDLQGLLGSLYFAASALPFMSSAAPAKTSAAARSASPPPYLGGAMPGTVRS